MALFCEWESCEAMEVKYVTWRDMWTEYREDV